MKVAFHRCLALMLALVAPYAWAQVYAGRTPGGTIVLSNFPGADTPTIVVAPADPPAATPVPATTPAIVPDAAAALATHSAIGSIVRDVAREVAVPAPLLHAVIATESGYDVRAVSPKGAQGLMQLMPATAQRFGVADPFDPRDNVRGGALYLKWLLELFGGDLELALAAYNAGENAVIRAGYRVPPYDETQRYVPRVLTRLQRAVRG
jgi:soluble lytic murein transglycosylase-like protein